MCIFKQYIADLKTFRCYIGNWRFKSPLTNGFVLLAHFLTRQTQYLSFKNFIGMKSYHYFSGNDGSACPLRLNPDGTYIKAVGWYYTEEWYGATCLKYNTP